MSALKPYFVLVAGQIVGQVFAASDEEATRKAKEHFGKLAHVIWNVDQ